MSVSLEERRTTLMLQVPPKSFMCWMMSACWYRTRTVRLPPEVVSVAGAVLALLLDDVLPLAEMVGGAGGGPLIPMTRMSLRAYCVCFGTFELLAPVFSSEVRLAMMSMSSPGWMAPCTLLAAESEMVCAT